MARPKSILVVDDDESTQRLLKTEFGRAGYQVTCARSGSEGLQCATAYPFDAAFVDFDLRDMSGVVLLGLFYSIKPELSRRSVIMSGDPQTIARVANETEFLEKPFRIQSALAMARRLLET